MVKAIIFDRDGILIESENVHMEAVEKAFADLGIKITEEEKNSVVGRNPLDYVNYFLQKYKFKKKDFLKIENKYYENLFEKKFKPIKEILNILRPLKKEGYLLGMATSSDKKTTDKMLEKLNLKRIFDAIVTVEECKNRKPSPDPYNLVAQKLGVFPKDCFVIEDSLSGLKSAKSAGTKCVVIPNKYSLGQDFSEADYIIKNPKKIFEIIKK